MAKLLSLLILGAACAVAQTVEGSVFDASTGAGVAGVKVELLRGGTAFYEAATDGGGRFRFDDVREGDYAVRYRSPDYCRDDPPRGRRSWTTASAAPPLPEQEPPSAPECHRDPYYSSEIVASRAWRAARRPKP